jgi:hypothetical protein
VVAFGQVLIAYRRLGVPEPGEANLRAHCSPTRWRPWVLTLLGDGCRMVGRLRAALVQLGEAQTEGTMVSGKLLRLTGDPRQAMDERRRCEQRLQPLF